MRFLTFALLLSLVISCANEKTEPPEEVDVPNGWVEFQDENTQKLGVEYTSKGLAQVNSVSSHDAIVVTRYLAGYLDFYFFNESLSKPVAIPRGGYKNILIEDKSGGSELVSVSLRTNTISDVSREALAVLGKNPGTHELSITLNDNGVDKIYKWELDSGSLFKD